VSGETVITDDETDRLNPLKRKDIKSEDLSRGGLNNSTNSITSFTYYYQD